MLQLLPSQLSQMGSGGPGPVGTPAFCPLCFLIQGGQGGRKAVFGVGCCCIADSCSLVGAGTLQKALHSQQGKWMRAGWVVLVAVDL